MADKIVEGYKLTNKISYYIQPARDFPANNWINTLFLRLSCYSHFCSY